MDMCLIYQGFFVECGGLALLICKWVLDKSYPTLMNLVLRIPVLRKLLLPSFSDLGEQFKKSFSADAQNQRGHGRRELVFLTLNT